MGIQKRKIIFLGGKENIKCNHKKKKTILKISLEAVSLVDRYKVKKQD